MRLEYVVIGIIILLAVLLAALTLLGKITPSWDSLIGIMGGK